MVDWLKPGVKPARCDVEGGGRKLLSYWSQWGRLLLRDGLVLRRWENEKTGQEIYQQICLPESVVPQVLHVLHNSPSAGHLGVSKTLEKVRENLRRAQKTRKAYYDTRCHGQRFHVGDQVWYQNRARRARKKFLKPWCGPWKIVKALSDVTYRIEEERRKVGQRRNRKVVHFNYLKPCFTLPPVHEKRPQATTSGEAARSEPRDVLQPAQAGADDSGRVELEWLEDPVVLTKEAHVTLRVQGASATLDPDAQSPEVPYTPEVPSVNNESSQIPVRPRRERREPSWLRDYVRTVVVYPTWPFTLVATIAY